MPRPTRPGAFAALLLSFFALLFACGEALVGASDGPPDPEAGTDGAPTATDGGDGGTTTDGAADAASDAADAATDAPCSADLPFGTAQLLTELAPLGDVVSVRLDHDGGMLAFVAADSGPPSFFDILEVPFPMAPSDVPTKLVSTNDYESTPAPLSDGMKVYFDQPGDAGTQRIAAGTRTQPGQKLASIAPEPLPLSPIGTSAMQPWSVAGTDVLYYVVRPGTASTSDVYRAERNGTEWESNAQLAGPFDETHPVVTSDELVMYYAFDEAGKRKIYSATRGDKTGPWAVKLPVDAANDATANDEPSWISPDQCTLIFTSDRSGAPRAYKIARQR